MKLLPHVELETEPCQELHQCHDIFYMKSHVSYCCIFQNHLCVFVFEYSFISRSSY